MWHMRSRQELVIVSLAAFQLSLSEGTEQSHLFIWSLTN